MRILTDFRVPVLLSFLLLLVAGGTGVADERVELKLWLRGVPGEKGEAKPDEGTRERITRVSEPTITLYRAPREKATGCAVVICPGGGYNILAYEKEGIEIAEWLNSFGVTAVLLKYRVPRRDREHPHRAPLQDSQRALRLVRKNAAAWGIDPDRLGILGFSAGGHLSVMTAMHWDRSTYEKVDDADELSCRPDFLIPIYAAYLGDREDPTRLSPLVRVTDRTPPTFMVVTQDDKQRGIHAALLFVELKRAGVPAELHIYSRGGHGYGLRPSANPVSTWPKRCEDWIRVTGLLEPRTATGASR